MGTSTSYHKDLFAYEDGLPTPRYLITMEKRVKTAGNSTRKFRRSGSSGLESSSKTATSTHDDREP